jgi:hypothetical protein
MHRDAMHAVADLGVGSGMNSERRPRFIGRQEAPASSLRKTPAAEMAMKIRPGWTGSRRIVCRPMPPAPGCQRARIRGCGGRRARASCAAVGRPEEGRVLDAGVDGVGVVSDGSRCQTRLNSHGCWVPSYQRWVPGVPS